MQQLPVIPINSVELPSGNINACSLSAIQLTSMIAELLAGNGWISNVIKEEKEHFLVLSHSTSAQNIALLGLCIPGEIVLNFRQTAAALKRLEALSEKYKCSQFCLYCPAGFSEKAEKLSEFNLLLYDSSDIEKLKKRYDPGRVKVPTVQLFAHNRATFRNVEKLFREHNRVAVVQATGTGKSYLIAKMLLESGDGNKLILAPGHYILDQMREHVLWARNVTFMTYVKTMLLSDSERAQLNPSLIVLDEFHRCGAEEWSKGINALLEAFPEAKVFGTSATPIRYMDESRDMSQELFGGCVAANLSLAQAIVRGILPMPKYISALYTLNEELNVLRNEVNRSTAREAKKKAMLADLDTFSLNWEKSSGIPMVLKKHLRRSMRKFIVFCRETDHLIEMETMVKSWFRKAGIDKTIRSYRVMTAESDSDEQLRRFIRNEETDSIHLLFSINMLNEGLHVNEVDGVILLRPTVSPNIFYQQIGRCLKVGNIQVPIIFDFVNNFNSIRANDFLNELNEERRSYQRMRDAAGLEDRCPEFTIVDEVREITEIFGQIRFQVNTAEIRLKELEIFKTEFGHCDVPLKYNKNPSLGSWVITRRQLYKQGRLESELIDKLNKMGFSWDPESDNWEMNFKKLIKFKNLKGHCNVPLTNPDKKFATWVAVQRAMYKDGKVVQERIQRLEDIGFQWKVKKKQDEELWEKSFKKLEEYKEQFGHLTPSHTTHKHLANWLNDQRKKLRKGIILTPEQKRRLEELGVVMDIRATWKTVWLQKFEELKAYNEKYGTFSVKMATHHSLSTWVNNQRSDYSTKSKLAQWQIDKLLSIGFEFKKSESSWNKNFKLLEEFVESNGHVNVNKRVAGQESLGNWLSRQKKLWRAGELDKLKINKLKQCGVTV